MHSHKSWAATKGGNITHSTCDNEDAKRKEKKDSGNSCCLRKLAASFPSNDKCVVSVFKNFFRVVIMTSLKLGERRMNCHDSNMLCLSQRSQVQFRIFFPILILIAVELVQPTMSCKNENCSQILHRSLKLTKLTNKKTEKLLEIYKASQGDSTDLICEMQMDNVPVPTVSGQTISERILSIYTHLKEFVPHLKTVMEQQQDLDPPTNPVTEGLNGVITHVRHMALRVNCLLQILQPNIPIPEPAERPTGIPPAQNIFQQKAYGCIVLSRLQKLLSQAVQEQKPLKGKLCRRRKKNNS